MRRFPSSWSNTFHKLARKNQRRARQRAIKKGRSTAFECLEARSMLAIVTWDGGGANNNWTTAANWVGDVAPAAGDDLVFSGTVRTSTNNNFALGTSFNSITFAANNFSLAGNRITLASSITVNSGVSSSAISLNVALGGAVTVNVVDTSLYVSGVLSGSNSLTKSGSGTLIVSGSNTYSGTTTISGGALQVDNGGVLGSGNVTNNSSLIFNRSTSTTLSNVVSGTGQFVQQGTGTLTLTGNNTYSGGTTISAGTLIVGNITGSAGALGTGSIANDGTLKFRRSGTTTLTDAVSGSGELIQDLGTLILAATNTYTGTTTLSGGGTLQVGNGGTTGTLGSGDVTSIGTRTLIFNRSDSVTVPNDISGAINFKQQGSGVLTVSGEISGTSSVTQEGSGTLVLASSNTYTGTTTVDATRTLRIDDDDAIGTGTVTINGTLDLNSHSPTVGRLNGSGTVTSSVAGSSTITVGDTVPPIL